MDTSDSGTLVVNHSVVAVISGGEDRIRGFLAAKNAATGMHQWRFDTIPFSGEAGHGTGENDAWRTGGGARWVTGSYDPTTDLLYWGVGNPSPAFNGDVRPGDNLFTDSVIACGPLTAILHGIPVHAARRARPECSPNAGSDRPYDQRRRSQGDPVAE